IGTVLAGIATGSAVGGALADRHDPRRLIGPLLVASAAAALMSRPVIAALGPGIARTGGGPSGILILALSAFVLPTALLSAVSPMVAKLRLASVVETGTVVGGLSAAGTAGALVGTFATGFVFIAALSSRWIVIMVSAALALTGIVLWVGTGRRPRTRTVALSVLLAAVASAVPLPCEYETRYYCATVDVDEARPSGRILLLDNLQHSYVDLDDPTHLEFRYARLFAALIDGNIERPRVRALHIGGGGFTLPRWLNATRPGSTNVVLELDGDIVAIAERELGLERGPSLRIRTGDARLNIADEPADRYDLAVGDAFGGMSVPWHLTTTEMLTEVSRVLDSGGLYVMNVIDGGERRLVRAELATLREVFANVVVVEPPDGPYGNYVLAASDRPITLPAIARREGVAVPSDRLSEFIDGAAVLRDEFAPADQLLSRN
ncbi:MAG: fused MFS/spermidine synthase, partial [Acidimicrobiia bacterium]